MIGIEVKVQQGVLRGKKETTLDGTNYYAFSGIPYAKPPVGQLRFKDPVPFDSWEGVRDATVEGNEAAQNDVFNGKLSGSEDCLYLNVYVPIDASKNGNLPVIFNIHSGGFITGSGSASELGPDYFIQEGVIMVSINYRLNVMGFLCTDAVNARGDMGLKDQNMALKWVGQNIENFCGNPANITLLGISAGAASVEYHLLSKMSRGLFHRVIMQSGSAINPFARTRNGVNMARRLAERLGFTDGTPEDIFTFINNQDTYTLLRELPNLIGLEDLKMGNIFSFTPVLNELEGYEGFIDGEPVRLLENGDFTKVPVISGVCDKEGIMMPLFYYTHNESIDDFNQKNFIKYVPSYLQNIDNLERSLKGVYQKRREDKNEDDDVLDFFSDMSFNGGLVYSLQQRLKFNPNSEYFYQFSYDGNQNLVKILMNSKKFGACHADDIGYLGPCKYIDPKSATQADERVRKWMVKMWTNFAKIGNPTPEGFDDGKWFPVTKNDFKYLDIDNTLKMCPSFHPDRIKLWMEIYSNLKI